jgi:hypothetical protein
VNAPPFPAFCYVRYKMTSEQRKNMEIEGEKISEQEQELMSKY